MNSNFQKIADRGRQQGAALIVGLMLLVVITIMAVSGMNTATTELTLARNNQSYENAFQAAELGLEVSLSQGLFNTAAPATITPTTPTYVDVNATTLFQDETLVPDKAFSLGSGSGISAYHFLTTSQAAYRMSATPTDRDASARHTQAFYVVGPESSAL